MVSKQILAKSSALETSKKAMDFSVSKEATPMKSVDVSSCHKVRKQSRKRQVVEMHDAVERNAEDNISDAIEEEEISIEIVQGRILTSAQAGHRLMEKAEADGF